VTLRGFLCRFPVSQSLHEEQAVIVGAVDLGAQAAQDLVEV
jgi:hypothetical protein